MEIIAQKRVGSRALAHIRFLAEPRFPGSTGEEKAQAYIRKMLQRCGYTVNEQEFSSSLFPSEYAPRLVIGIVCSLIVVAYYFIDSFPALSIEIMVMVLLLMIFSTQWSSLIEKLYSLKRFGVLHSKNLIAMHPHRNNHINVVFTAHYDSKSQTLSGMTRFSLFTALMAFSVFNCFGMVFAILNTLPELWLLVPISLQCAIGMLLQFNTTSNKSPGAYDNASGVAVLLELAQTFSQTNPNVNLAFVATGAEEAGLCGAVALMHDGRFLESFPPSQTIIINFDGIGCEGAVRITNRFGLPPRHTGLLVSTTLKAIGDRFGIAVKNNWILTGAAMDHIPFAAHGYQTVTVSTAGFHKAFRSMHTAHDVAENLSLTSIEHCYAIAQEFVDSIPATNHLFSTN